MVDKKGRLLIPDEIRKQYKIEEGDVFFIQVEETGVIRCVRDANSFDLLAEHAVQEYRAGRTRDLREIAAEGGIDLDAE